MSLETASSLAEFLSSNLTVIYSRIFPPFFFAAALPAWHRIGSSATGNITQRATVEAKSSWGTSAHCHHHCRLFLLVFFLSAYASQWRKAFRLLQDIFVSATECVFVRGNIFFLHSFAAPSTCKRQSIPSHTHTQYSTGRKATPNKPDDDDNATTMRPCARS